MVEDASIKQEQKLKTFSIFLVLLSGRTERKKRRAFQSAPYGALFCKAKPLVAMEGKNYEYKKLLLRERNYGLATVITQIKRRS